MNITDLNTDLYLMYHEIEVALMYSADDRLLRDFRQFVDVLLNQCLHVEKIWAVGCNKRFMFVRANNLLFGIRISNLLYSHLKLMGVPTSQSLRSKK